MMLPVTAIVDEFSYSWNKEWIKIRSVGVWDNVLLV